VNDAGWTILTRYSPRSALPCLIIGKRLGAWALVTERRDRAPPPYQGAFNCRRRHLFCAGLKLSRLPHRVSEMCSPICPEQPDTIKRTRIL
jgi:hypothetical protein